jgi:phospholipid transport system substrate-binding protein
MPISEAVRRGRRAVLRGLASAGALAALGGGAAAQGGQPAAALVTSLAAELQKLVASGQSEAQVYAGMQRILTRYADMPAVAASALGPPWRSASAGQRQAFVAAFQSYLARKYGAQFRDYRNATISVLGTRDGGRAGTLVQTVVNRPGQSTIAVDWQVSDRSGAPKVVKLVIEGVSMLANDRAEIGAMLDASRGSIDGLTAQLKARS